MLLTWCHILVCDVFWALDGLDVAVENIIKYDANSKIPPLWWSIQDAHHKFKSRLKVKRLLLFGTMTWNGLLNKAHKIPLVYVYLYVEDCKLLFAKKGEIISPCEICDESKGSVTSLAPTLLSFTSKYDWTVMYVFFVLLVFGWLIWFCCFC